MRHIEVLIDGNLEKIYFPLIPFCENLPSNIRDEFNLEVDRSS